MKRSDWTRRWLIPLSTLVFAFALGMSVAVAASDTFSIKVPPFGSKTSSKSWTTVDNNHYIQTKYTQNPEDSQIKAVRCSDGTDISGCKFVAKGDHSLRTLATNVLYGTCFRLNIDTPGNTWSYDTFKGYVCY